MVGPLPPVFGLGQGTSEPLGGAWLASSALRPLLQGSTGWWPSPRLQAGAWVRARAKGAAVGEEPLCEQDTASPAADGVARSRTGTMIGLADGAGDEDLLVRQRGLPF